MQKPVLVNELHFALYLGLENTLQAKKFFHSPLIISTESSRRTGF
jgi:hypothetical protein